MFGKYVGSVINIIYMNRSGEFTKRRVKVLSINNGIAKVYCYTTDGPRTLVIGNIYGVELIGRAG